MIFWNFEFQILKNNGELKLNLNDDWKPHHWLDRYSN